MPVSSVSVCMMGDVGCVAWGALLYREGAVRGKGDGLLGGCVYGMGRSGDRVCLCRLCLCLEWMSLLYLPVYGLGKSGKRV